MSTSRVRRRILLAAALGVALPAAVLAGIAVFLTFRIAASVQKDAGRYNSYLAQLVGKAFEQELMDHLRQDAATAERVAREGGSEAAVRAALEAEGAEFEGAHFVPVEELGGYSLIMVESAPLLYAPGEGARAGQRFCGLLLRRPDGDVLGAGGWWVDPAAFVRNHFEVVLRERLPSDPRMYGGIELTRRASIEALDAAGRRIGRVREPGDASTVRVEPMQGPFETLAVRVAVTPDSPIVWTRRFLAIELMFVAAMGLVIAGAMAFGYRYLIRQLELAQLKAGFLSNVTHELKTPIAMIRLGVETLQMKRFASPEEEARFLGIIERETQKLTQLVDNILDFARLEAGRAAFRFGRVDLRTLVADAVESLRPRLDHLGFSVEVELPESLPPARADAQTISHAVLNLLDNAIKYSRTRKEIRVRAAARDRWVTVSVSDRGIGIAPGDRKRIFEKFVRLENGLVHDVRGAGLGLSLVDQIIRAHHGRIEVQSTPGEGSTFTLWLPVADGAEPARSEPAARTGT
uniref:histidine kinase n=1 Tax=Eiseniibacteriota bacterium TaxID=2212470 RepID=A0A832I6G5_UNCEI